MMHARTWILPLLGPVLATLLRPGGLAAEETALTLARDGKPAATIILSKQPTRSAQFAAFELQWHLKQITGAEFPIVCEDQPVTGTAILVGDSSPARAMGIDPEKFQKQEYLIRVTPKALVLVGHDKNDQGAVRYRQTPTQQEFDTWPGIWDEQGTMYAVYDFLERFAGVRWFTPTEFGTVCPRQATFTVTGGEIRRQPFMRYRYAAYPAAENYDQYTGLWPAGSDGYQQWETGAYPQLKRQFTGGAYTWAKRGWNMLFRLRHREGGEPCFGNHSLYGYYRRFWAPEKGQEKLFQGRQAGWFAQGYQGQPPQMCYTSPGLIAQVAQDACEFFETGKNYPGAQAIGDYFCVEPMDNSQFCKCDSCQKWLFGRDADNPFFTNGRHSDYFFQFVNEVAKRVASKHPQKRIVTLAYMTHGAPPEKLRLEKNVLVQYCFACNRLTYDRPSYRHEVELLERWRREYPDPTFYLWLYDTFPAEVAANGKFLPFPGFFAHKVGEQFDLFQKFDYRGVFHCGYGQEVEAYLTYRLMDDPRLRVDALLDEYFTQLYGAAAGPIRRFYETIEEAYGNPANYPEAIATERREGHHHQTEEIAWGYLGNATRMKTLGECMEQARAAARSPAEKQRVALVELGVWRAMQAGRAQYLERAKARFGGHAAVLRVPLASPATQGKRAVIDASEATALVDWRSPIAEPTRRRIAAGLLHDGRYLYVQLQERCDPKRLVAAKDLVGGDYWQVLFASRPNGPVHCLLINPEAAATLDGKPFDGEVRAAPSQDVHSVSVAVPLTTVGIAAGGTLYFNAVRRSKQSDDQPMWSPSFGAPDDPAALRRLVLDDARSIPADISSGAEFERLEAEGLVARWRMDEAKGTEVRSSPAGLAGRLVNGAARQPDSGRPVVRLDDSRQQWVDLGNAEAVNLTGPLTLMAWVKYEPTDTWYPALLGKGYEATGAYGMHLRPGGTVWFELDAPDGTRHIYNPTDLSLTPGQWRHVAATYDGRMMRIYLNGREAGGGKTVTTAIRVTTEPLRFGWLGSYGYFNGCLRDLSLYRRALSAAEVFAHYQSGRQARP